MLHKNRSRSTGLWKYGFTAPLFILMLIVSAAAVRSEETIQPVAEAILRPLPIQTSKEIMSALDLNNSATRQQETHSVATSTNDPNEDKAEADYAELKKHIQRNIRYPTSARQNNITGYVVANLQIRGKKITNVRMEKGLQKDIDDEVIRTLSLFTSDINVKNGRYFMAIAYQLHGVNNGEVGDLPDVGGKNFMGQVIVTAMASRTTNRPVPDYSVLKRHIQKTIQYPIAPKSKNISGFVIADFNVKDKKISTVSIRKALEKELDEEVIRTLSTLKEDIDVPDDKYSIAIVYSIVGADGSAEAMPNISAKNFVGQILVAGYLPATPITNIGVKSADDPILDAKFADVLPEFPTGPGGLSSFLAKNLRYTAEARKNNIQGKVILGFFVNKDGSIEDIKVLHSLGYGLDEEAVKALKLSPNWKPGMLKGQPVKVALTIPIGFGLTGQQKP